MCHLLFAMPVVGLLAFLVFPLYVALAIYLGLLAVSSTLFVMLYRAQRRPVASGLDALPGGIGEVTRTQEQWQHGNYLVRYKGESWNALCDMTLEPGEKVRVKSLTGNRLVVEPLPKS